MDEWEHGCFRFFFFGMLWAIGLGVVFLIADALGIVEWVKRQFSQGLTPPTCLIILFLALGVFYVSVEFLYTVGILKK